MTTMYAHLFFYKENVQTLADQSPIEFLCTKIKEPGNHLGGGEGKRKKFIKLMKRARGVSKKIFY